ncbi:hypothetical protein Leryth_007194 [Lithospermum erythrorhizon]|nr:hypothetical protein Leryth_007194 [Lithospermum erythrorhizon]
MKKLELKLDLIDGKDKRKAMKTVSSLPGIDEITMDMKGKKLTVIGTVDPVSVVSKLRKFWPTDIISVGPAKEPETKEEPKKEEGKKEDEKEETKGDEQKKEESKEDGKKEETKEDEKKAEQAPSIVGTILPYRPYYPPMNIYYPPMNTAHYVNLSVEENPNECVIC